LWLNNFFFVMTRDLWALHNKIGRIHRYRSTSGQARNFLMSGHSGAGKSTYLDWLTIMLRGRVEAERNLVPAVNIEAPTGSDIKALYQRILHEYGLTYARYDKIEDLFGRTVLYLQQCGTELLFIDEIANMTNHDVRRRLIELSNAVPGIPIVGAACTPESFVGTDAEIEGRFQDRHALSEFTGDRLVGLLNFLDLLLPFGDSSLLAVRKVSVNGKEHPGPAELIEEWTKGHLRDIMCLLLEAARYAVQEGEPRVTVKRLTSTWSEIREPGNGSAQK
jgi:hypothetical protein